MCPYLSNPARRTSVVECEHKAAIRGFCNKTMRRAKQAKPHIAYIKGYWRVSPWKPGTGNLYYAAHGWINYRNYKLRCERHKEAQAARLQASGEANGSYLVCDDPTTDSSNLDQKRSQLTKQLRHGLNYGMSAGDLLRNLEAQVEAEQETKQ